MWFKYIVKELTKLYNGRENHRENDKTIKPIVINGYIKRSAYQYLYWLEYWPGLLASLLIGSMYSSEHIRIKSIELLVL